MPAEGPSMYSKSFKDKQDMRLDLNNQHLTPCVCVHAHACVCVC